MELIVEEIGETLLGLIGGLASIWMVTQVLNFVTSF